MPFNWLHFFAYPVFMLATFSVPFHSFFFLSCFKSFFVFVFNLFAVYTSFCIQMQFCVFFMLMSATGWKCFFFCVLSFKPFSPLFCIRFSPALCSLMFSIFQRFFYLVWLFATMQNIVWKNKEQYVSIKVIYLAHLHNC